MGLKSESNQIYLVTFMCLTIDTSFILQKNQMFQNVFLISVTLRCHSGVKNHVIWTFKVYVKKCLNLSKFFFIEEYQFRTIFFVKYIF